VEKLLEIDFQMLVLFLPDVELLRLMNDRLDLFDPLLPLVLNWS
jgi:hypothetical protein